jgi:hypothetical protein
VAYSRDKSKLLTQVFDIPIGGGLDEKTQKHLFNPPFLAEGKNVEIVKTGALQKRNGIQSVVPPSGSSQPYFGTGTLFEHPGLQMAVVGQPDFSVIPDMKTSLAVVEGSSSFATSNFVASNTTGIYACGIEQDPLVRTDDALLHVQTSVSGNKILIVWCSQVNPVTVDDAYNSSRVTDNRCHYMVKERDTGTIITPPTRLYDPLVSTAFANHPRYTHISLVDSADPHWVIVAAPEVYPEASWEYLSAASISVSNYTTTYAKLNIISGQSQFSRFTAFDMHAGQYSSYAHIIAQASTGSGHNSYVFRIDKTLSVSLSKALLNNELPLQSGAIYHDMTTNTVFTAVSNQDGIAGALPGDGESWLHRYSDSTYAVSTGYPIKLFSQTVPAAWPSFDVGITGACTRLTVAPGTANSLYVFGTQFWNPAGYAKVPPDISSILLSTMDPLKKSLYMSFLAGSKSMLNTKFVEVQNAFSDTPSTTVVVDQPSCYITTKGFKGQANSYPMVGLAVTNGEPATGQTINSLSEKTNAIYNYKFAVDGTTDLPEAGGCVESQPSKHPMGVIAAPMLAEKLLRPVARFGVDYVVECEDVFPYECGVVGSDENDLAAYVNVASRWLSPGLSSVNATEVNGELHFAFRSRLVSGVSRLSEYNRFRIVAAQSAWVPPLNPVAGIGGTFFSKDASGAFGAEEVRLNLSSVSLRAQQDASQTHFSGGYLGFFDGVDNGESDMHSSPGQPYVSLTTFSVDDSHPFPPSAAVPAPTFANTLAARYSFVLVYALHDGNGLVHRSAPSPVRTVRGYRAANAAFGATANIRYLMPPPSAFFFNGQRAQKLLIEVYATASDTRTTTDMGGDKSGAELSYSNFTLIDQFEPELVEDLSQYSNALDGSPGTNTLGSTNTPWSLSEKQAAKVRSGFRFFGERILTSTRHYSLGSVKKNLETGAGSWTLEEGQLLDTVLYTTGGVIENDPPPAFVDIHTGNGRMWGIPSDNRSSLWYSKKLGVGKPPEWSAAFSLAMPRSEDTLTAISSMDEKVVVFSKNDVFIIAGDGPNNLGRGGGFVGPRKVASDVGCVNKSSVVTGPFGVMFQSERGIYVLTRSLETQYIGSRVEDQITSDTDISAAVLIEDRNQVRFSLNKINQTQLKTLCYDYLHQVWTLHESASSVVKNTISAAFINGKHTVLGADNYISRDADSSYFDGSAGAQTPIVSTFTTAWVKLAGLQGYKRVRRVFLLGQHLGGKVSVSAQYNYNEGVSTTKSWTDAEITALSTDPMQLGIHIPRQKCESIRFIYSDEDAGQPAASGDVVSSISIQFGAKNGMFKMSEGSKK